MVLLNVQWLGVCYVASQLALPNGLTRAQVAAWRGFQSVEWEVLTLFGCSWHRLIWSWLHER